MIASWMNNEWNSGDESNHERSMVEAMLSTLNQNCEWRLQDSHQQLREELQNHPKWTDLCARLVATFGEHEVEREIDVRTARAFRQPASIDEARERFMASCFRDASETDALGPEVAVIVENLKDHPNWPNYVEFEFNGDLEAAVLHVCEKWKQVDSDRRIGSALFVNGFETTFLDAYSPNERIEYDQRTDGMHIDRKLKRLLRNLLGQRFVLIQSVAQPPTRGPPL